MSREIPDQDQTAARFLWLGAIVLVTIAFLSIGHSSVQLAMGDVDQDAPSAKPNATPTPARGLISELQNLRNDLDRLARQSPPVGTVVAFAGQTAPPGWLICDGSALDRQKYPELHKVLSETFGNDAVSLNLPDLRGRVALGAGPGRVVGASGGRERHQLTIEEMPRHTHQSNFLFHPFGTYGASDVEQGRGTTIGRDRAAVGFTGEGREFEIMPPFSVLNYIIRASSIAGVAQ